MWNKNGEFYGSRFFQPMFFFSGLINSILSWGLFKPLARMNYITYLVHIGIIQLVLYQITYTIEFTDIIAVSAIFWDIYKV